MSVASEDWEAAPAPPRVDRLDANSVTIKWKGARRGVLRGGHAGRPGRGVAGAQRLAEGCATGRKGWSLHMLLFQSEAEGTGAWARDALEQTLGSDYTAHGNTAGRPAAASQCTIRGRATDSSHDYVGSHCCGRPESAGVLRGWNQACQCISS